MPDNNTINLPSLLNEAVGFIMDTTANPMAEDLGKGKQLIKKLGVAIDAMDWPSLEDDDEDHRDDYEGYIDRSFGESHDPNDDYAEDHPCPTCDGEGTVDLGTCLDCGGDGTHLAYQ